MTDSLTKEPKPPIVPTYRDYNRLLRNQVLMAVALENIAAMPWDVRKDERAAAIDACKTIVTEADELDGRSRSPHGESPTGDYEQAGREEPSGSTSESHAPLSSKTSVYRQDLIRQLWEAQTEDCPAPAKRLMAEAAQELESVSTLESQIWAALGATDVGQDLVWTAKATASLSRTRQETILSQHSDIERLRTEGSEQSRLLGMSGEREVMLRSIAHEAMNALGEAVAMGRVPSDQRGIVDRLYLILNGETQQQTTDRQVREIDEKAAALKTDIVEMCRDPVGYWNSGLRFEAANEIERLRELLTGCSRELAIERRAAQLTAVETPERKCDNCGEPLQPTSCTYCGHRPAEEASVDRLNRGLCPYCERPLPHPDLGEENSVVAIEDEVPFDVSAEKATDTFVQPGWVCTACHEWNFPHNPVCDFCEDGRRPEKTGESK